jgi:putative hydrolase of the HAD superfamily
VHALETAAQALIGVREGTCEFLEFLGGRGIPAILTTNAHPRSLARKMARTGLAGHFSAIVSAHELGAPKEAPEFWQGLRHRVHFDPGNALFVDDNATILRAARSAGIRHVFGVRTPSSSGGPHHFAEFASINALTELIPWLASRSH